MAKFREETNHYARLLAVGAEVAQEPTFHYSRAKVCGAMWEGRTVLKLRDMTFHLLLYSHLGDKETLESVLPHYVVKGIVIDGKYHDVGWYCIFAVDSIWVHPTGWFGFDPEATKLDEAVKGMQGNANCRLAELTAEEVTKLESLGFTKVLDW